jgi:hypothetical protein
MGDLAEKINLILDAHESARAQAHLNDQQLAKQRREISDQFEVFATEHIVPLVNEANSVLVKRGKTVRPNLPADDDIEGCRVAVGYGSVELTFYSNGQGGVAANVARQGKRIDHRTGDLSGAFVAEMIKEAIGHAFPR